MHSDHLLAFERIVREGNFGKAARALGITQPSISARIAALEREAGSALLERSRRGVSLTEQGRAFLPYARRVLEVMDEGSQAVREVREGSRGKVNLGAPESLARGFLVSAILRFRSSHPEVDVSVMTGRSDQVVEMVHDGVAKLGLITSSYLDDGLATLCRFREPLVAVAHPDHPLTKCEAVSFAEVVQEAAPFLLVGWSPAFSTKVKRAAHRPGSTMEVPVGTAQEMLLRGTGASFLARSLVGCDLRAGRLTELTVLDPPRIHRESSLVRPAEKGELSTAASAFVEELRLWAEDAQVQVPNGKLHSQSLR